MEVYCRSGYVLCPNRSEMNIMRSEKEGAATQKAEAPMPPFDDPFSYLEAVVRRRITVAPSDLPALENNMTVVEILEAAKYRQKKGGGSPSRS